MDFDSDFQENSKFFKNKKTETNFKDPDDHEQFFFEPNHLSYGHWDP